jgi:DNA segregation ATPase FtsK/SpoIIIE-like protein
LSAHETTSSGDLVAPEGRRQDVFAILTLTATVLLTLALISYDARNSGANLVGPVGHRLARALMLAFGLVAWFLPLEGALLTYRLFRRRAAMLGVATMASTLVLVVIGASLGHLLIEPQAVWGASPGGAVGELLGEVLRSLLGFYGTVIIGFAVLGISVILRTPWTLEEVGGAFARLLHAVWVKTRSVFVALREAWAEARDIHEEEIRASQPRIMGVPFEEESQRESRKPEAPVVTPPRNLKAVAPSGPTIVAPKETKQTPLDISKRRRRDHRDFELPPTTLLDEPDSTVIHVDADALRENAELLTEKLAAYGVRGRVDEIHPGPVVTMYEFEPQSGTKISKIAGLADDLAMALAAQKVRIVAPIAGKARVGFELPNDTRQTVPLREILEDRRWEKHTGALPVAMGKDIGGQPVYADLARMPHLLVAGATGSGKSVGLNVMLTSILSKKTPDEVRMLMVDPKVVELQVFDGIPHMLLPVVTDMKKAALALRWAVDEMERRYQMFADAGTRNIDTYNRTAGRPFDREVHAQAQGQGQRARRERPGDFARSDGRRIGGRGEFRARKASINRRRRRRVRGLDDGRSKGRRSVYRASGSKSACSRDPRDPRHSASERRRHYRHDQSELPGTSRLQGLAAPRLDDHPRSLWRRAPPRNGRHVDDPAWLERPSTRTRGVRQ